MLSIFHKFITQVFEFHDPNVVEPSMLNLPPNWDGNALRMTENKMVDSERSQQFVELQSPSHAPKMMPNTYVYVPKRQPQRVVHFSHPKIFTPSFVNSHVFINTYESKKFGPHFTPPYIVSSVVWFHKRLNDLRQYVLAHNFSG